MGQSFIFSCCLSRSLVQLGIVVKMFTPKPKFTPKRLPRRVPKVIVPSYIGESGQVGNWLFYNGAGGVLHDFGGKENHGDFVNDPEWVDGSWGWALDFDGEDDYVEVPDDPSLNVTEITVSVWVRMEGIKDYSRVVHKSDGYEGFQLQANGSVGAWRFVIGDGSDWAIPESSVGFETDVWHFLVGTFDGSTVRLFVDAGLEDSVAQESLDPSPNNLGIGTALPDPAATEYFNGIIDNARIYDHALSESEIKAHYEATKPLYVG